MGKQWQTLPFWAPKSLQPWNKKTLTPLRKILINLDSILKSRDITLPTKVRLVKAMFVFFFQFYLFIYFTILYWFCHTLTWIHHGCTCVPHPESPTHLPPHPIPLGHPNAPVPSTLYHVLNLNWRFISHMIICMFQCHSFISSYPRPLPQSPKDCSIHLCLFCCLAYRVIVTIFLNSIYMC